MARTKNKCRVNGCNKTSRCKKLCQMHYERLKRTGEVGEPEPRKAPNGTYAYLGKYRKKEYIKKYRRIKLIKSNPYMQKQRFGGMRQQIFERDNYKCVMCGMTMEQHKQTYDRELTINHIDHLGRYSSVQNNDPDNLETLCLRCHGHVDAIKHGKYSTYQVNNVGN